MPFRILLFFSLQHMLNLPPGNLIQPHQANLPVNSDYSQSKHILSTHIIIHFVFAFLFFITIYPVKIELNYILINIVLASKITTASWR